MFYSTRIFVRRSVSHLRARATTHGENLDSNFLGIPGVPPFLIELNSTLLRAQRPDFGGRTAAKGCETVLFRCPDAAATHS